MYINKNLITNVKLTSNVIPRTCRNDTIYRHMESSPSQPYDTLVQLCMYISSIRVTPSPGVDF